MKWRVTYLDLDLVVDVVCHVGGWLGRGGDRVRGRATAMPVALLDQ